MGIPRKGVFSMNFLPCVFLCAYYLLNFLLNSVLFNASNSVLLWSCNLCLTAGYYMVYLLKKIPLLVCPLLSTSQNSLSHSFHPTSLFCSTYSYTFQDISQAIFCFFLAQQDKRWSQQIQLWHQDKSFTSHKQLALLTQKWQELGCSQEKIPLSHRSDVYSVIFNPKPQVVLWS